MVTYGKRAQCITQKTPAHVIIGFIACILSANFAGLMIPHSYGMYGHSHVRGIVGVLSFVGVRLPSKRVLTSKYRCIPCYPIGIHLFLEGSFGKGYGCAT